MSIQFGGILKERRKEKKLTLAQIANLTGLSAAYLSLLERNMNSPTIENLNRVCAVLDLTLSDLIERASTRKEIVSHPGQRAFLLNECGYTYEAAFEDSRSINCIIMTVRDQESHNSTAHVADEIGYVVQGSMIVTVNGVEFTWRPIRTTAIARPARRTASASGATRQAPAMIRRNSIESV